MKITQVPMTREPEKDRLFKVDLDSGKSEFIRIRVLEVVGESTHANPVDRDVVTVQLQSSIAKDASGDVQSDVDGTHLIFSASRHSLHLDAVADGKVDAQVWLAGLIEKEAERGAKKAAARGGLLSGLAKLAMAE